MRDDVASVADSPDTIVESAIAPGAGIRVVSVPKSSGFGVVGPCARALAAHGFVVVRAGPRVTLGRNPPPAGRHLALICLPGFDRESTASLVRQLGRASPRGHVIVLVVGDGPAAPLVTGADRVRERPACYQPSARDVRRPARPLERPRETGMQADVSRLVAAAELDRAEALLAAARAEAQVLGSRPEAWLVEASHALAFWRGRFDRIPVAASGQSAAALGWCGLGAWARREPDGLAGAVDLLRREAVDPSAPAAGFWLALVSMLAGRVDACPLDDVGRGIRDEVAGMLELAVRTEARLTAGRSDDAAADLRSRAHVGPELGRLLYDWLLGRCAPGASNAAATIARIRRAGAEGIFRWGEGKGGMQMSQGLAALLQLVQDADNDQAALAGGCGWLRRHAGADAVALFDAAGARLIASDGWHPRDGSGTAPETVAAPVRSGRATIGRLVARGPEAGRPALEQAMPTLAALIAPALRSRLDALELAREADRIAPEILGRSPSMVSVREAIARAAGTPFPVLIEGESGTGKELVARALHRLSPRRDRAFAAINCAALSDELIEAELFGHARGAFTGALGSRTGLVEWAHGGTLFLDEVGELSPRGQAKLLRVLQEREIRRVGENAPRSVDVRVIAATNVPLVESGGRAGFRQDLLFRLAVIRIRLPALRDRVEDIPLLAQTFWQHVALAGGRRATLGPDAVAAFCRHAWPGNVRELQNVMAGLALAAPSRGRIGERHVRHVLASATAQDAALSLGVARQLAERRTIAAALARHGGRRTAAAVELGLTRQGLTKALRRLGLSGTGPKAAGVA